MMIVAPMARVVFRTPVHPGDDVQSGTTLVVLESMKMEIPVVSDITGKVARLLVAEGNVVDQEAPLLELLPG